MYDSKKLSEELEIKKQLESTLAAFILQESHVFLPVLHEIGCKINDYLHNVFCAYRKVGKKEEFYDKIGGIYKAYLFNRKPHFGRLSTPENAPNHYQIYQIARKHLTAGKTIEHILTCFLASLAVFEFLKGIECEQEKLDYFNELGEALYSKELFAERGRYRLPIKPQLRKDVGIYNGYNPHIWFQIPSHVKAVDSIRFNPDKSTFFVKYAQDHNIPLVAGPSSHSAGLFRIGLLFVNLNEEQLLQYSNCICAFLIAAGAHSFHEIMSVAKNIGVPYQEQQYMDSLSLAFKKTPSFKKFQAIYFNNHKTGSTEEIETENILAEKTSAIP